MDVTLYNGNCATILIMSLRDSNLEMLICYEFCDQDYFVTEIYFSALTFAIFQPVAPPMLMIVVLFCHRATRITMAT